jgi:hypothetical protein
MTNETKKILDEKIRTYSYMCKNSCFSFSFGVSANIEFEKPYTLEK